MPNNIVLSDRWCTRPGYAAFTTALGVFAGFYGSLYSEHIKRSFPLYYGPYEGFSWVSLVFWLLLVSFTFLFFLGQRASGRQRAREQDKLIQQSANLEHLVMSLPPKGFLTRFSAVFTKAHSAFLQVMNAPDASAEDVEHAVRVVLDSVATLASDFDEYPHGAVYAANIMLYKPTDALDRKSIEEIQGRLAFTEPEVQVKDLRGVLDLEVKLSTTTETEHPEPDDSLVPLALPLPKELQADNTNRYRLLPGAPLAFALQKVNIYPDTSTLGNWCRENGDFSPSLCATVERFFASSKAEKIRSFISVPLGGDNGSGSIAVLNIHRDQMNLLHQKEPLVHFIPLMQPFLCLLTDLIVLRNVKNAAGG